MERSIKMKVGMTATLSLTYKDDEDVMFLRLVNGEDVTRVAVSKKRLGVLCMGIKPLEVYNNHVTGGVVGGQAGCDGEDGEVVTIDYRPSSPSPYTVTLQNGEDRDVVDLSEKQFNESLLFVTMEAIADKVIHKMGVVALDIGAVKCDCPRCNKKREEAKDAPTSDAETERRNNSGESGGNSAT